MNPGFGRLCCLAAGLIAASLSLPCEARSSRLPGTGGVQQVEGAAGGGLVPWALVAGLGSDQAIGASAFLTRVDTGDYVLDSFGLAVGMFDRLEISAARLELDIGAVLPGESLRLEVWGAKLRLLGDAVYDQDRWWPQLAAGVQYKSARDYAGVPALLGARRGSDVDWYLAATKLYLGGVLGRNLLLNATARRSRANQLGLLGFGGDLGDRAVWRPEASAALFLHETLAVGAEYRWKPDQLGAFREQAFRDVFVAWIPQRHVSATAAWVDLGEVAGLRGQRGWYLSLQLAF